MNQETREACLKYIQGAASARRMNLWDRYGTDYLGKPDRPRPLVLQEYWTPSVRIHGKQHGVIGPDGYMGHYTRKEAVAQAQAFIDKCRALIDEDNAGPA